VRRELAKQDSYFRYTDTKDVEDALRDWSIFIVSYHHY
jgi:hypothetical protein